jgi:hypothetical protein
MTKRLVNPTVKYISILTDEKQPANGKPVIIKGAKYEEICKAVVKSIDEIEGDIHWRAMISGENDTDDETYTKEDVKNAQRKFMKSLTSTEAVSDHNHNMEVQKGVYMVESHLIEEDSKLAWDGVSNVKENEILFQKAKEGKITGVSIYGWVEDVQELKSKSESSMIKDMWNKIFGKAETLENYNKEDPGRNIYKAWNAFYNAVIDWDESKGGEYIKVSSDDYIKNVDDLTAILKSINIKKENKEVDMTKEQIKALSDEELKEFGFMRIPETTEEPKAKEAEPETQAEPDKEKEELKSANEKLTADLESLKAEMKDIIKQRTSDPTEKSELKSAIEPIKKSQWEKLDTFDKHNFKIEFPEIANKYENGL